MSDLIIQTTKDLVTVEPLALDQNPASVYITQLKSAHSRRNMERYLNEIARLLGIPKVESNETPIKKNGRPPKAKEFTYLYCNWAALRYQHTAVIRTKLSNMYAPATVNVMLSALRGVIYQAWKLEFMSAEDYQRAVDVENITGTSLPAGRDIKTGEMLALAEACGRDINPTTGTPSAAGIRDAAIIGMLYTCGLRRSELAKLKLTNFEAESGKIEVISGKGGKSRTVYVTNGALEALTDWLALRGDEPGALFHPVVKSDKIQHRPMTDQAVYNMLKKRGHEANLKDFAAHDFRRTFAGDMLDRGVDIVTVQKIMGHADPKTTSRYDRRPEKTKQDAANKLHFPYTKKSLV